MGRFHKENGRIPSQESVFFCSKNPWGGELERQLCCNKSHARRHQTHAKHSLKNQCIIGLLHPSHLVAKSVARADEEKYFCLLETVCPSKFFKYRRYSKVNRGLKIDWTNIFLGLLKSDSDVIFVFLKGSICNLVIWWTFLKLRNFPKLVWTSCNGFMLLCFLNGKLKMGF